MYVYFMGFNINLSNVLFGSLNNIRVLIKNGLYLSTDGHNLKCS